MDNNKEHKSFRITSKKYAGFSDDITKKDFWKYKKLTRKEYGAGAITCILLGFIIPILFSIGLLIGIIWIYKTITHKN